MENTIENINDLVDFALEGVENALGRKLYKTEDQKLVLNVLKLAFAKYKDNDNLNDLLKELRKYKESSLKYSDGNNSVWHATVSVSGNEVFLGDTLDDLYNKCHELIEKREDEIQKALKILNKKDPKKATRRNAIKYLEGLRKMADLLLSKVDEDLKSGKLRVDDDGEVTRTD